MFCLILGCLRLRPSQNAGFTCKADSHYSDSHLERTAVPSKMTIQTGLPYGICIFKPKIQKIGFILEGLAMEDVGTFYGHLVYFTAIGYILW
jgi:hypothetical protein